MENSGLQKQWGPWMSYAVKSIGDSPISRQQVAEDSFGGRSDEHGRRSGYFHAQKLNGRWWLVDPLGNLYLSNGVDSVAPGSSPNARSALAGMFGNEQAWMESTHRLLLENGNNSVGAWSALELLRKAQAQRRYLLSYAINLSIMSAYGHRRGGVTDVPGHNAYPEDAIFVFDPAFKSFARSYVAQSIHDASDPNLLGYFSDNEIPLLLKNLDGFLRLPHSDAGYRAAKKWMDQRHASGPDDKLRAAFLEFEAHRYFSIVSYAIHHADPHHMYLGCRFYGSQLHQPELFRAAGAFADVISINVYNVWQPSQEVMDMWQRESGKPFLVTEFYVKAEDSGMPNKTGAGWLVHTQKDRGLFYQNFVLSLLQSRSCIGWDWFKYQDNDPDDPKAELSNLDSNKGIVDNKYRPYADLLQLMQQLNTRIYQLTDYLDHK